MHNSSMELPKTPFLRVFTSDNGGHSPDDVAQMCVDKIIAVGADANPVIQAQAIAYKEDVLKVVAAYMRKAINSDRESVYNVLNRAGRPDLVELIRSI